MGRGSAGSSSVCLDPDSGVNPVEVKCRLQSWEGKAQAGERRAALPYDRDGDRDRDRIGRDRALGLLGAAGNWDRARKEFQSQLEDH